MNKIYPKLILIVLLVSAQLVLKAQVLHSVQDAFDAYNQNHLQEKLFIHTDKEQYVAGELLWLKIYAVNGNNNQPIGLSKIAYIELLSANNQPLVQTKISLDHGKGSGSVRIPTGLTTGAYKVRAYTNWMKNFGADLFFEKQLILINPLQNENKAVRTKTAITLQFFPEGGDLIEGIPTNVAFKVVGADGKGISLKGAIVDQKNDTVSRFETFRLGMGRFSFTPLANQQYRVVVAGRDLVDSSLPTISKQGYSLLLEDKDVNRLNLTVRTNLNVSEVYLFVHQGNKTSMAMLAPVKDGKALFELEKKRVAEGVSYLTIFDAKAEAVAERLYFKRPNKKLKIDARSNLSAYNTRTKVNVDFFVRNENEQAINADLSVSIRRLDSVQGLDQSDIQSYLWLGSELKGYIENPSYYFQNNNAEVDAALDNLLLTQGWRKLAWQKLMKKDYPIFKSVPELQGHLIKGKLTKNGAGVRYANVYLSLPESGRRFYSSQTDADGNFTFNVTQLYGVNELVVQTDKSDTSSLISISNPFSEQYTTTERLNYELKSSSSEDLELHSLSAQVQNNFLSKQLQHFYPALIDTGRFYGKPFKTYILDNYTRFRTMEETLREYTTEVFVSKNQGNFNLKLLGKDVALNDNPLVLLDGVPYFDMNKAMNIDPNKVQKFEIVPEVYLYGASTFQGILSFSSFKSNLTNIEINPNSVVLDYDGLQLQREFYQPIYENVQQMNNRLPDFRNVLYWSPSLYVDGQGKGRAEFYTSDLPGTYIGVINGLSSNGTPGTGTFTFEVNKK